MNAEYIYGERRSQGQGLTTGRIGPMTETIVNDVGLGRFFEAARLGRIFHSYSKTITVAATHNSPVAANTATPVLGFINPTGSGVAAVLLRGAFGTTSGTPAGGQGVINVQANAAGVITAATTGSIYSAIVGTAASPQGSQMRAVSNVALAGWLSTSAPVEELFYLGQATAVAAAGNIGPSGPIGEDIGGLVIIPPGALCAIMAGNGAGTTWIVNAMLSWAEVPWPL